MYFQAGPHRVWGHRPPEADSAGRVLQAKTTSPGILVEALVAIIMCAILLGGYQSSEGADKDCEEAKFALESNKRLVREYVAALENAKERGEAELIGLLTKKIDQLVEAIVKAEPQSDCDKSNGRDKLHGIGPVKSEENEYVTKSCDELRTIMVQLLRKTSPLKRRATSTFSELSSVEKQELDEATRDLKAVLAATHIKCREGRSAPSLKRGRLERANNPGGIGLRR